MAWSEKPFAAAVEGLGARASVLREHAPALYRGGVELGEERLLGLRLGFGLCTREPAAAREVAQDATVEQGCDLADSAIGERLGGMEGRPRERARARVHPVQDERVEVEVEIERAPEALRHDDRTRATALDARPLGPLPQPAEERAHEDAPHGCAQLPVVGEPEAHGVGEGEYPLTDGDGGQDLVGEVQRRLRHAPAAAGGTEAAALAGEGHELVPAALAAGGGRPASVAASDAPRRSLPAIDSSQGVCSNAGQAVSAVRPPLPRCPAATTSNPS